MGDFVHYQDEGLKNLIITDPQWLVDMFKALITAEEFLDKRSINQLMLEEYKRTALLSKSTLQALWKGQDIKFLTELMKKFQLIVPLTNTTREYLVPCMLPPRQLDIYESRLFRDMTMVYSSPHAARSSQQSDNFLPVGSYHRLLALLYSSTHWKLCVNDHLTYSDVSFEVEYGVRVALTLLKHIRVTVWCGSPAFKKTTLCILPNIREAINKNSKVLGLPIHEKFLIMCPQQQIHSNNKDLCMVPVSTTDVSFVPQIDACIQHDTRVYPEDYSWLLKPTILPNAYTRECFPHLQSLVKRIKGVHLDNLTIDTQKGNKFPIMMVKDWRQFMATVSQGRSQTLKPQDSDVSLTIPRGVLGVLKGCVHTDHSRFVRAIPANECIISPMVEFHHCALREEDEEMKHHYVIKIPHCIPDKSMWKHIRVRRGNIYENQPFTEITNVSCDESESEDEEDETKNWEDCYEIDEKFITVHTSHFTDFTCTMCNASFCANLAMVFLFGSLRSSEERSLVKIQPFLCSFLYVIEDYKSVSALPVYKFHRNIPS